MAKYTLGTEYYIIISQRGNSIHIIYSLTIIRQENDLSNAAVHFVQLHRMKRNKILRNNPQKLNEYNIKIWYFIFFYILIIGKRMK